MKAFDERLATACFFSRCPVLRVSFVFGFFKPPPENVLTPVCIAYYAQSRT